MVVQLPRLLQKNRHQKLNRKLRPHQVEKKMKLTMNHHLKMKTKNHPMMMILKNILQRKMAALSQKPRLSLNQKLRPSQNLRLNLLLLRKDERKRQIHQKKTNHPKMMKGKNINFTKIVFSESNFSRKLAFQ